MRIFALVTLLALLSAGGIAFTQIQTGPVPAGPAVSLELIADNLTSPVILEEPPDGTGRLFIADQVGQIWIMMPDGHMHPEPFLDIGPTGLDLMVDINESYDERGLLGLAFHPQYAENGRFFIYYSAPLRDSAPDDWNHTSHISEFTVSITDTNKADPTSEQILLYVDQPQSNHNAGTLEFGPDDGYLYISLGDGGAANDVALGHVEDWYDANAGGNAQDIEQNLLGSMLRIDVDPIMPTAPAGGNGLIHYGIPPSNPFTMTFPITAPHELQTQWAYGFRNPYRFSFDMDPPHTMYVGDAGQDMFEEVSIVESGGNYGWNVWEGAHCFDAEMPENPPADCPDTVGAGHPRAGDPLILPVIDFLNANQPGGLGLTVIGGYVYRGDAVPGLDGDYLFGVWSQGENEATEMYYPGDIFIADTEQAGGGLWSFQKVVVANGPNGDVPGFLLSFGQGAAGAGSFLPGDIFIADTEQTGGGLWSFQEVVVANGPNGDVPGFLLSFGQDRDGEVYVLTTDNLGPSGNTGKVYRIVTAEFEVYMPAIFKPQE